MEELLRISNKYTSFAPLSTHLGGSRMDSPEVKSAVMPPPSEESFGHLGGVFRLSAKLVKESGQTLLEVIAAVGVATIVAGAITMLVITSLSNSEFSRSQSIATQYAQDGMEVMRKLRDTNWSSFRQYTTGTYCFPENPSVPLPTPQAANCESLAHSCNPNVNNNLFKRDVCIAKNASFCGSNVTGVTVTVFWSDSRCPLGDSHCHKTKLASCLGEPL